MMLAFFSLTLIGTYAFTSIQEMDRNANASLAAMNIPSLLFFNIHPFDNDRHERSQTEISHFDATLVDLLMDSKIFGSYDLY